MKEQPKKSLIRLLLPLSFSSLVLLILLCGLSRATGAEPGVSSASASGEMDRPSLLDYQPGVPVCEQTPNLVPNPGFEQGIGCANHWCEGGDCVFQAGEPGHDSGISAVILAASARDAPCMLFTPIDEIPVEGGRVYDYAAWIKADLSAGETYLRITFWSREGDPPVWKYEGEARTNSVTDTQGPWVRVTGSVQAPAAAEYARVEAVLPCSGVGTVWFDDVFLGLATCLECSKRADPDPVAPGEMLTYTLVCSNTGREKATDVEIIETYDPYVVFRWADPAPFSGTPDRWMIPELPPGASVTIVAVVRVEDDTDQRAYLLNYVQARSDETAQPVYTCISTTVTGTPGCAVFFTPLTRRSRENPVI